MATVKKSLRQSGRAAMLARSSQVIERFVPPASLLSNSGREIDKAVIKKKACPAPPTE